MSQNSKSGPSKGTQSKSGAPKKGSASKSNPKASKASNEAKSHAAAKPETVSFQADIARLLQLMAHALYADKEVFLRELISNAADACDKRRYQGILNADLAVDGDYRITLSVDKAQRRLTISDNGIGMSREDLTDQLGTVARSGTQAFLERAGDNPDAGLSLIGQFGVGFYAVFMVAGTVSVHTRRAGEGNSWLWVSDGQSNFTITGGTREDVGTSVCLHLKEGMDEFLDPARLEHIVKTYSDHIAVPIVLESSEAKKGGETPDEEPSQLNMASALWTRPSSEVTAEQYTEFYRDVAKVYDEPWSTLHFAAEGLISYRGLLFIPEQRPLNLFDPERKGRVKLYVQRVFITEDETLLPGWLRFVRGVVDSEDLPLGISREMLQNQPVLAKIKAGLVKRVLAELDKRAADEEAYLKFWSSFGAVLKEGIYEDAAHRESLLKLARFRSTHSETPISLKTYVERMKPGQKEIFTLSGEQQEALAHSPQLEGFRHKGVEVLYFTDPVDEFWPASVSEFEGHAFQSVTHGAASLEAIQAEDGEPAATDSDSESAAATLALAMKTILGDEVKDVRVSRRLRESPVCLVADADGPDLHLERILRQNNQMTALAPRVLEINPRHPLIQALCTQDTHREVATRLLLDQARILGGETVPDPQGFAERLGGVLTRSMT